MSEPTAEPIKISVRDVFGYCVAITTALLIVHVLDRWLLNAPVGEMANVDLEANIPTWWAQAQFFLAALLALLVAVGCRRSGLRDSRYWFVVAGLLTFMSVDEGAEIHERFGTFTDPVLEETSGLLWWTWVLVAMVLVLITIAFLFRFWLRLPRHTRTWLAVSAAMFVFGAVFLEMLGAQRGEHHGPDDVYMVYATIEEALEFYAVAIAIYAILTYMRLTPELRTGSFEIAD